MSALFYLFSSGKSRKAVTGAGIHPPAETLVAVVYLLLESNLFFILLKSQDVMVEKKCAPLSIGLTNSLNKILGSSGALMFLISFHMYVSPVSLIVAVGFPGHVLLFDWSLGMQEQEQRGDLKCT